MFSCVYRIDKHCTRVARIVRDKFFLCVVKN